MNNFTEESLKGAIEKCKANIAIFEEAIEKEEVMIKELKAKIKFLREKEELREELVKNIIIEVEVEDGSRDNSVSSAKSEDNTDK